MASLGVAREGSEAVPVVGGFQIEPTSDYRAGPGDSRSIRGAVGDSRQICKGPESARVKYRFAAFSWGDDGFHDSIVGAGGRPIARCCE